MARIAEQLRLSEEEIDALMSSERRLRIATIGPGTDINLTPMTFGWSGGRVYVFARGQKVANLRRNATATVLVDVGEQWRELKGIMMRGQASVLEDAEAERASEFLDAARLNLGEKHGLVENGSVQPYAATAAGRSRRWIEFVPATVVSWNNERL